MAADLPFVHSAQPYITTACVTIIINRAREINSHIEVLVESPRIMGGVFDRCVSFVEEGISHRIVLGLWQLINLANLREMRDLSRCRCQVMLANRYRYGDSHPGTKVKQIPQVATT